MPRSAVTMLASPVSRRATGLLFALLAALVAAATSGGVAAPRIVTVVTGTQSHVLPIAFATRPAPNVEPATLIEARTGVDQRMAPTLSTRRGRIIRFVLRVPAATVRLYYAQRSLTLATHPGPAGSDTRTVTWRVPASGRYLVYVGVGWVQQDGERQTAFGTGHFLRISARR